MQQDQTDSQGEEKRGRGRPKGSYKRILTLPQVQDFTKEIIYKITRDHISFAEYQVWCRKSQDMSYQQCVKYWNKTWKHLKEKYQNDRDKLIDKQLHKLWELYEDAYLKQEFSTARAILADITKLQGLNEPEKVEITNKVIEVNFGSTDQDTSSSVQPDQETE